MTRELLQRCLDIFDDTYLDDLSDQALAVSTAIRAFLNQQPPVAYAILDKDGAVIGVEKHAIDAKYWLNRGIPGRTIKPLYL